MGIPAMSLINQVLKELDARGSDAIGTGAYVQQARAVPERQRAHPAWFVAGASTLLFSLAMTWLLLRSVPQQAPNPSVQPQLPKQNSGPAAPVSAVKAHAAHVTSLTLTEMLSAQPASSGSTPTAALPSSPVQATPPVVTAPREKEHKSSAEMPMVSPVVTQAKTLTAQTEKEAPPNAVPLIKQLKEPTPQQRADNVYRKALQALQDNKPAEAIKGFESALQLDAGHVGARYALISTLLDANGRDDAVARAREGLSLDPAQPGLSMILARLQVENGELRAAIDTLEHTLPYAADRADYQAFLAALLQRDEHHKQAIEHYWVALQRMPQNGVWWMGMGISLQAEHRLPEAVEAFKRAKASNNLSSELVAFVDTRLAQLQR